MMRPIKPVAGGVFIAPGSSVQLENVQTDGISGIGIYLSDSANVEGDNIGAKKSSGDGFLVSDFFEDLLASINEVASVVARYVPNVSLRLALLEEIDWLLNRLNSVDPNQDELRDWFENALWPMVISIGPDLPATRYIVSLLYSHLSVVLYTDFEFPERGKVMGKVSVGKIVADNNGGSGVRIQTKNDVHIGEVSASGNTVDGVTIVDPILIKGLEEFLTEINRHNDQNFSQLTKDITQLVSDLKGGAGDRGLVERVHEGLKGLISGVSQNAFYELIKVQAIKVMPLLGQLLVC